MSNIVIAPWGDPSNWKRVTYIYEDKEEYSFSSTIALSRLLNIDTHNIIIFLASTLIDRKVNSYDEMKVSIEGYIYNLLVEKEGNVRPKLCIVPGIGTFIKNNKRFVHKEVKRGATNYYNAVYYNTLKILNNINDNKINIYLDITHGINYMAVLCSSAVNLASNTYAAVTGKRVKVITCNSDPLYPIPREDDKNVRLHINRISSVEYNGYKSTEELLLRFVTDYLINKNYYINTLLRLIEDIKREDIEKIHKAAKAFATGIAMILTRTKSDIARYKSILDKILDELETSLDIKEDGQDIIIEYKHSDSKIALLHSIISVLDSISLNIDSDYAVTLKQLENVSQKYYQNVIDSVYYIVNEELDRINEYSESIPATYILYGKLKYVNNFDESRAGKTNSRVLYAHAGLEENVTWVRKVNDDIYISYLNYFNNVLESI